MLRVRHFLVALAATALCAGQLAAQTGAISGRTVNATTRQPLGLVSVNVANRTIQSDADGQFFVANMPVGTHEVRARFLGYGPAYG